MPCARGLFFMFSCIAIFTACLVYAWNCITRYIQRTSLPQSLSKCRPLEHIKSILHPPGAPLSQLLLERSSSNARLLQALSLTNSFVDPDPCVHGEFVRRSRGLLRDVQANGWTRFHETCVQAVQVTLQDCLDSSIKFDKFVQIVVLRSIMVGLLNVGKDVEEIDVSSLTIVTTLINDLWSLSKSGAPPPSDLQRQLHDHLRHLVPLSAGFDNPIDFVVPTWETMWRVCATIIARSQESEEYQTLFHEFLQADCLTTQHFIVARGQGFSVRNFVEEAMRLHPPVKRISRLRITSSHEIAHHLTYFPRIAMRIWTWIVGTSSVAFEYQAHCSADVEAALRAQSIWSHDADCFKPLRHQSATRQMEDAQRTVFGYGPLRCVAASWAPDAAAVISATILEECRGAGWDVVRGERIGGRTGWDGWKLVKVVNSHDS